MIMSATVIAKIRSAAESTLTDRCTVRRATGSHLNAQHTRVTDWATITTGQPCLVQQSTTEAIDRDGLPKTITTTTVKTPVDADITDGDLITVTASLDPRNRRSYRITGGDYTQGWAVLRRFEATATEEQP